MVHVDGETLRALRAKLGISQDTLTSYIRVSKKTITRYENQGTTNAGYVHALLSLLENPRGDILPPVKRGRPTKPWQLVQPHRHSDYGEMRIDADAWNKCAYRLWLPGHSEHCRAITAPPTESGLCWLERGDLAPRIPHWRRYRRLPNGQAQFLDIVDLSEEYERALKGNNS